MLHTYPHDYKVVFVGDASMSPYEITAPGGSVEHFNDEPGQTWLERVTRTYPAAVWLNPVPEREWDFTYSIQMVKQLMGGRMYPLDARRARQSDAGVGAVNHKGRRGLLSLKRVRDRYLVDLVAVLIDDCDEPAIPFPVRHLLVPQVAGEIRGILARGGVAGQIDAFVIVQDVFAIGEMEEVTRHGGLSRVWG